jgi:pimeloyl-ACP methyl ester carboxylesterase
MAQVHTKGSASQPSGGRRARVNGAKEATPTEEFPVEHISIHGHQIGYRRGGEGPVLLLLHGIAGSSRTWVPAMTLLQSDYTVLAPDFLGHGASAKPPGDYSLGNHASAMRDFLHLLDIDRATVVGQSFGGGVAMQFAYQFPERCERLVFVDAGGLGREVNWILRLITLPAAEYVMPVLFPAFVRDWGDPVARFLGGRGIGNAGAAEMWRSYRSLTEADNRRAFVRTMRAVIDPGGQSVSAVDRLYLSAHMPTLIVWGDHDRIIPLDHAYKAHEAIPNSRLEVMEGVGHYPHVEEPVRFVEILRDFLRTTEPAKLDPEELRDLLRQGRHDEAERTSRTSAGPQL